ncbi:hypothetical protein EV2_002541 [Malus domestica]
MGFNRNRVVGEGASAKKQRLNIVLGVSSALAYLHEECERQIIHRDVKTCDIMLDADFNAKLGDFGLAEVYEHSVDMWLDINLELARARKPVEDDGTMVVDWVWSMWEKGKLIEATDPRLLGKFDTVEMEMMLMIGLASVHPNLVKRPTVKEAAKIFKGEKTPLLLPSRKPKVSLRPVLPDDVQYLTPKSHFDKD